MSLAPLSPRDRKALLLLGVCAVVFTAVYLWPAGDTAAAATPASVPQMEQRVKRLRRLAAGRAAREEALKKVEAELARREKGIINAETPAQAQAQMLQLVRRVAQAQQQPIVLKGAEFGPPRRFGRAYGEVALTISFDSPIEQIVTFLTDLSNQPELIAASELQLSQAAGNKKLVPARVTLTGIVPARLAPEEKKGDTPF